MQEKRIEFRPAQLQLAKSRRLAVAALSGRTRRNVGKCWRRKLERRGARAVHAASKGFRQRGTIVIVPEEHAGGGASPSERQRWESATPAATIDAAADNFA